MLKNLHLRLTVLCTAVIGTILIIITLFYLYVSETNMKENHFHSFQNDMKNMISGLENQTVITDRYLASLEAGGRYLAFVEDNDTPILYGNIIESTERRSLLEEVNAYYKLHFETSLTSGFFTSNHSEFIYTVPKGKYAYGSKYYACFATLPTEQGNLKVTILSPVSGFYKQLTKQRIIFAIINFASLLILCLFFYLFIGHLLHPIEENQKRQTQFVASASHELRTPLSVILSCASLIPESVEKEQQQFCNTILQEGNVMKRLLSEMLLLASSDNRGINLHKEESELDTMILNCVETFESLAKEKKLELKALLPDESLPLCLCDKTRIEQVLSILLHNAVSYTPEGGSITVSVAYQRKHFVISVADTGIGISDENKKRIFERFYRADSSHSAKDHFGLGLSIAHQIIKQHKGTLRAEDTPGGGSTFVVELYH